MAQPARVGPSRIREPAPYWGRAAGTGGERLALASEAQDRRRPILGSLILAIQLVEIHDHVLAIQ
jgi:hypothetical protein